MSLYLTDANYLDWESLALTRGTLCVEEGTPRFVEHFSAPPGDRVLDCSGAYVTRSFACGHHHIYSALARGMPAPPSSPKSFTDILERVWWRLDRALDLEAIRASALATAVACLKNGVTFVIDHHSSPRAVSGSLETVAHALEEAGVGHLLCYELSDRDGGAEAALEETATYLASRQGLVGLHASFTVGDASLRAAVELAERYETGIHVHVAEDGVDESHCLERYGKRVLERFEEAGVLASPRTILAHCLHLDAHEWSLLDRSPVWIAQSSESNLNNGVGSFEARGAHERVMLGTDGMHSDMIRSARAAFLVGQSTGRLPAAAAYRRLRGVHRYLRGAGFRGDAENNLVVLDYDPPTELRPENFTGHLLFGLEPRHVRAVISSGRLVMLDGKVLTLDEEEVMAAARESAARVWSRMQRMGGD